MRRGHRLGVGEHLKKHDPVAMLQGTICLVPFKPKLHWSLIAAKTKRGQ